MTIMTAATRIQTVPQVLLAPWGRPEKLTELQAACLAAALEPATAGELAVRGFDTELIGGLLQRGMLAPAVAEARLWHRHGWGRPEAFLHASEIDRVRLTQSAVQAAVSGVISDRRSYDLALGRRSLRRFAKTPVSAPDLRGVLAGAVAVLTDRPYLRIHLGVLHVSGMDRGVYRFQPRTGELKLTMSGIDNTTLLRCAQGQQWALGSGCVLFIAVNWTELKTVLGSGPSAYMIMLADLGRVGHVVVLEALKTGLGSTMTPALSERYAAEICGITDQNEEEVLYMVRLGLPKQSNVVR